MNNGFCKITSDLGTHTITIKTPISTRMLQQNKNVVEEQVKRNTCQRIVNALLENNFINISENEFDHYTNECVVTTSVTVVVPPKKMVNILEDRFYVDGVYFDSDDLIEAVRNTFPDKFI